MHDVSCGVGRRGRLLLGCPTSLLAADKGAQSRSYRICTPLGAPTGLGGDGD